MPVLGMITEFNPLHNGHQHFIRQLQMQQDFSAIVCVMSGNFSQRGEAAICNKWVRAQMALEAGVDLVFELPFCFSVRSAFYFARGGIQLLARTGVVTHLAFGSEIGQLPPLQAIARLLAHETNEYKTALKLYLDQGLSFPAARAKALQIVMGSELVDLERVLLQPNNILALEYLRVLEQESLSLVPLTIPRKGPGYNSTEISSYASATAIRHYLRSHPADSILQDSMPQSSLALLRQEIQAGRAPVFLDNLGLTILAILRTTPKDKLRQIYEISEGLENRILEAANSCGSLEELKQAVKSKRYSSTRISRLMLYILLALEAKQILDFDQHGPLYLHTLGFSTKGRKILQEIKNKSSLQVLSRGSEVKAACQAESHPAFQTMLRLDVLASDIYTLLCPGTEARHGSLDYTTSPVILGD